MSDLTSALPPLFPASADATPQIKPVVWSRHARPLGGLHAWLKGALIALTVAELLLLALSGSLLWVYAALEGGVVFSDFQLSAYEYLTGYVELLSRPFFIIVSIASGFLFCRFIYRAISNLDASNARGDRIPPGWAVAYNFIPIVSLWKPLQAMTQAWRGSLDPDRNRIDPPWVTGWWWAGWVVSGIAGSVSFRLWLDSGAMSGELVDFEAFRTSLWLDVVSSTTAIASIFFLLPILAGITKAQDARTNDATTSYPTPQPSS